MEFTERELHVARILSGMTRLRLWDNGQERLFILRTPTPSERYMAIEAATQAVAEAEMEGLWTEAELLTFLRDNGLWTEEKQKMFDQVEKDIDTLKVKLYQMAFRSAELLVGRRMLLTAKNKHNELYAERHFYDHMTAEGQAPLARMRYMVGRCLLREDGSQVWKNDEFMRSEELLLDEAVNAFGRSRAGETTLRELARTEPWRSIWSCRHSEGTVFGKPAAELSDEQRHLTVWSRVYDNAYEDSECPPDSVVNDDDMFDGWLIIKRREREKAMKTKRNDSGMNEKIANSGEVFIINAMPEQETTSMTAEEIAAVNDLNDEQAAAVKARRLAFLKQKGGTVLEAEMPDSKEKILAQMALKHKRK